MIPFGNGPKSFSQDKRLAGHVLGRKTYTPMRAVIKAALAEPLTADERAVFDKLSGGRDPPTVQVAELVIIASRASGKTQGTSALGAFLSTCRDWSCDPGQIPVVLLLAADREQAAVAFRYVLGLMESSPVLSAEIESNSKDRIVLKNGVEIQVATSDFRAVRGRSIVAAICDEMAFWPLTPESVSPDTEVLTALRPGLARFRGSLLIVISTPYAQQGALYEYDQRFYGQNDPRVLVVKGATRQFNSTFPQDVIDDALLHDPAAAASEYLCQYRTDVAAFIDVALVDSVTRTEPRELPRRVATSSGTPIAYVAGLDVSGGRGDATGAAVAHLEGDRVVIDACRRWIAPHDPAAVAAQVFEFFQVYGLEAAVGDQYGAEVTRSLYMGAGITTIASDLVRSDIYLRFLPLLTTGRIQLPPEPTLRVELLSLERRTARSGKDSVDHRPGAHDDLSNAVALAAVTAARSLGSNGEVIATPGYFAERLIEVGDYSLVRPGGVWDAF
jgi:hypothetical protein